MGNNYSEAFQTVSPPVFRTLYLCDQGCDILPKEQYHQRGRLSNLEKLTPARRYNYHSREFLVLPRPERKGCYYNGSKLG